METETFIKTSHARGRDGLGEHWEKSDVCGTRTVFDNGDTRTQEAIVGYDNHPQDSRVTECKDGVFGTLPKQLGTGGGNAPFVASKSEDPIAVLDMQGGKIGANYQMGCATTPAITRGRGSADDVHSVAYHYAVRRITPIEGERLQGFADNWTRPCFTPDQITDELVDRFVAIHLEWAKINAADGAAVKPKSRKWVRDWLTKISSADCPDGPRYKAIGNSMSVNVMNWIGQVIDINDKETRK